MTDAHPPFGRGVPAVPLAIPVLLTTDPRRALVTYRTIGFEVFVASPSYLILRGFGVEMHISQVAAIPKPDCVSAYLRVCDVDAMHRAFHSAAPNVAPPVEKPWGMKEFHFVDGDGNLISVGQMIA